MYVILQSFPPAFFLLSYESITGRKKITAINVNSNTSITPMPSYDPAEAHSMDDNYQNIEDLFKKSINFARMQNVSTNTTSCTSKSKDRYFELIVDTLR